RQMAAAAAMYAIDFDNAMIGWDNSFTPTNRTSNQDWTNTISPYIGKTDVEQWIAWGTPGDTNPANRNDEIPFFRCPADAQEAVDAMNPFWRQRRPVTYTTPFVAASPVNTWFHPNTPKVTVWESSDMPMLADIVPAAESSILNGWQWNFNGIYDNNRYTTEPDFVPDNVAFRHGNVGKPIDGVYYRNEKGKAVTLFLDGHASAILRGDFSEYNMTIGNRRVIQRIRADGNYTTP
ncbi:MAG: hypothetical protein AAF743_05740, partial [Planctomycetota bacterium]